MNVDGMLRYLRSFLDGIESVQQYGSSHQIQNFFGENFGN